MRSVRFAGNAPTLYLLIHMMYMSFPREFTFSLTIPRSYARFAIPFERNTAFVGGTRSRSDGELRANIDDDDNDDDYDDDSDDDRVAGNESRNFAFACRIYRESTLLYPLRCIHQLYQMVEKTHTHTVKHSKPISITMGTLYDRTRFYPICFVHPFFKSNNVSSMYHFSCPLFNYPSTLSWIYIYPSLESSFSSQVPRSFWIALPFLSSLFFSLFNEIKDSSSRRVEKCEILTIDSSKRNLIL